MELLRGLFNYSGRSGPAEYVVVLFAGLVLMVAGVFLIAATGVTFPLPVPLMIGALIVWVIATVYVMLVAHVRRRHDIERSRRTRVVPFVPFLGAVILLFIPGDGATNDHGPPRGFIERRR